MSDQVSRLSSKYDNIRDVVDFFQNIDGFTCITPPQFDKRIISQSSVYLCGNNPNKKFNYTHNELIAENKESILKELTHVNITNYSLMLGLENLTTNLNTLI